MKKSTWFMIAGVGLVLVPIPPVTTIPGILLFATGAIMRDSGD